MQPLSRRAFLHHASTGTLAATLLPSHSLVAQSKGDRPLRTEGVRVLNPRGRVPVGLIIDDSTCLVNLNRFAMPQFDSAFGGSNATYQRNWREWPLAIPDSFVRKFGEWCANEGVKGKYSIVPYPACVGRIDRGLPGWTQREIQESLNLVRTVMMPNWDIHPEMVTHTRVIDLNTGQPYADHSLKFMENWEWTTGRSADEIAAYMVYALQILKNVGLPCEGITTPGGFGNKALPQLSQAAQQALRAVFRVEVPHYFRHVYDRGEQSVAPRVEYASGLGGTDPRCVVSVIGCTGDWTGGWDNVPPESPGKFITEDLQTGRMVDVIQRGEPAFMLAHWTGIYWNAEERGFKVFQEVVRRLKARFDNLIWMKLSEVARYWAAKELTAITREANRIDLNAPFACSAFTFALSSEEPKQVRLRTKAEPLPSLRRVNRLLDLQSGTWFRDGHHTTVCFELPKGASSIEILP